MNKAFPGWKNIAMTLLEKGECVVAGNRCIWNGGVGNFIETKEADGFFGCIKYVFHFDTFKESLWYFETMDEYKQVLVGERDKLNEQINEIELICQKS